MSACLYTKDDIVTTGMAYGYEIGQSKRVVLESILKFASSDDYSSIYVSYQEGMNSKLDIYPIAKVTYDSISRHDQWDVAIGSENNFLNGIRFTFRNDILVKIYRHRQLFELP